jgi:hypothetical protein
MALAIRPGQSFSSHLSLTLTLARSESEADPDPAGHGVGTVVPTAELPVIAEVRGQSWTEIIALNPLPGAALEQTAGCRIQRGDN